MGYFQWVKEIIWQPKAKRQLKKIREQSVKEEILDGVESLTDFPHVPGVKPLKNHQCTHRLKVGTYRVLFSGFETVNIISIEEVKKRNEHAYR